jgi:hypothetical protein
MKCRCGKNKEGCECIKYIVLDLDATLISTEGDEKDFEALNLFKSKKNIRYRDYVYTLDIIDFEKPGYGSECRLYGLFRPHLKEFVQFIFKYFDEVVVWSAGKNRYVKELCRKIFPIDGKQPFIVYTYDDCVLRRGKENDIIKPLDKLYKDPRTMGKMNEKNTFILDDNRHTFVHNSKNAIHIPVYSPGLEQKELRTRKDDVLLKVMHWLTTEEVIKSKDVRKLDKDSIFD